MHSVSDVKMHLMGTQNMTDTSAFIPDNEIYMGNRYSTHSRIVSKEYIVKFNFVDIQ